LHNSHLARENRYGRQINGVEGNPGVVRVTPATRIQPY